MEELKKKIEKLVNDEVKKNMVCGKTFKKDSDKNLYELYNFLIDLSDDVFEYYEYALKYLSKE